jgi:hypothetical protein
MKFIVSIHSSLADPLHLGAMVSPLDYENWDEARSLSGGYANAQRPHADRMELHCIDTDERVQRRKGPLGWEDVSDA